MRSRVAWWAYAVVAGALALIAVGHWLWAVTIAGPVMYGEGAVAHAAILARDRLEYTAAGSSLFVAANYPPLYFQIAGLADPFVLGRVVSIAAAAFVAGAVAWRARAAGPLVAATLALAWLGSIPAMLWGPTVKPDLLALGLTVGAVLAIEGRRSPLLAGALVALAIATKPTAALPALALGGYLATLGIRQVGLYVVGALGVAVVVALSLVPTPDRAFVHLVEWNALPWALDRAIGVIVVGLSGFAVPLIAAAKGARGGALFAYALGGFGIVILGGREGATINYLLDISVAAALGVASLAPRLRVSALFPIAAAAQLMVGVLALNPFDMLPEFAPAPTTGAWGDPARIAAVRALPGSLFVEDSGLVVATGREPKVDDVFLWSRLFDRGASFPEGERVLRAVRDGEFDAVVAEVDLSVLANAPTFRQQRWHPLLVAAVLERYRFDRFVPTGQGPHLYVYLRRPG
jgi:hypothetical protein